MTAHLAELLSRAAAEGAERVALVEVATQRRLTWSQLDAEVDLVARGFGALGVVAGYRVVVMMANRVEFVTTYLGALRAGLVVVPTNPRAPAGELARLVADCTPRIVVADRGALATARAGVAGLADALVGADEPLRGSTPVPRIVAVGAPTTPGETSYDDLVSAGRTGHPLPMIGPVSVDAERPHLGSLDPERLAVLLYTSGTSGRPRAAMLSHRAMLANVRQLADIEPPMLERDDVVLGVLPLFHVYGLNAVLGQVLRRQARLVLVDGFDAEDSVQVIEQERVSVLPLAPAVFASWQAVHDLGPRLAGVRLVVSGSAPISSELVRAFTARTGLEVHQGYGLTEAAPVVTSTLCSTPGSARGGRAPTAGSVGAALPGVELRIVDDSALLVEGEDAGEIWVRGDNLFSGWWPDASEGPTDDGWYATGDVGFVDPDGDLFLVDRLKELVVVSGFNVYPAEVERVIVELEEVAEVAVIGTADARTGEAVVAYVRPAAVSYDAEEIAEVVLARCDARLARFKRPAEVQVVDRLPHTVTGKVAKGRLRAGRRRSELGLP